MHENRTLEEVCQKRKGANRPKEDRKLRDDRGGRWKDRRFHDLEPAASYSSEEHATEPCDCICMGTSSVRNEVFTTLDVLCPREKGVRKIKLKVNTGAAGNTLPL